MPSLATTAILSKAVTMSAHPKSQPDSSVPDRCGDWVRVPAVVNASGDKVVTLNDEQGRSHTLLVAEILLETLVGPRPAGYVVRFKDGNRLNCELILYAAMSETSSNRWNLSVISDFNFSA